MTQPTRKILLIGKPGTSKTTFIDQFYGLVELDLSCAKLRQMPESIAAIERGRSRLAQGQEVGATPSQETALINLQLLANDVPFDLDLLDYGGEQVRDIIDDRRLPAHWHKLANECDTWLLFLRIHDAPEPADASTRPVTEALTTEMESADQQSVAANNEPLHLNEAVSLIELLQILLAARNTGYQQRITTPRLKLVVSLWDMLHSVDTPETELRRRHPLLVEFMHSNWATGACSVWGLSPQGFALDTPENVQKYLQNGSEEYARVILPDGKSENDLALLLL
ncbi:MAG: hypothetical protein ACRYFX_11145 [Janthinobacterium lividum]